MNTLVSNSEQASQARRIIAALYPERDDEQFIEQCAAQSAQNAAEITVDDRLTDIEAETGQDVWDVAHRVREAANSCVPTDILYAFFRAHKINQHIHLSDAIDGIYKRLDVTEYPHDGGKWSEYVIFSSMKGGVDIDAISCWGKDGFYSSGKNAIYGVGDSGYYMNDVLLVSVKACRILDEMEVCFEEIASSIARLVEAHLEQLRQDEYDYQYETHLAELTEENEELPEDNSGIVKAELDAGGVFARNADGDYVFESATGVVSFTVSPQCLGQVFNLTIHEAEVLIHARKVA